MAFSLAHQKGQAASNFTEAPVVGCVKARLAACNRSRGLPLSLSCPIPLEVWTAVFSTSFFFAALETTCSWGPYRSSPRIGWPIAAICTRSCLQHQTQQKKFKNYLQHQSEHTLIRSLFSPTWWERPVMGTSSTLVRHPSSTSEVTESTAGIFCGGRGASRHHDFTRHSVRLGLPPTGRTHCHGLQIQTQG